jgi:hypothetical protein
MPATRWRWSPCGVKCGVGSRRGATSTTTHHPDNGQRSRAGILLIQCLPPWCCPRFPADPPPPATPFHHLFHPPHPFRIAPAPQLLTRYAGG